MTYGARPPRSHRPPSSTPTSQCENVPRPHPMARRPRDHRVAPGAETRPPHLPPPRAPAPRDARTRSSSRTSLGRPLPRPSALRASHPGAPLPLRRRSPSPFPSDATPTHRNLPPPPSFPIVNQMNFGLQPGRPAPLRFPFRSRAPASPAPRARTGLGPSPRARAPTTPSLHRADSTRAPRGTSAPPTRGRTPAKSSPLPPRGPGAWGVRLPPESAFGFAPNPRSGCPGSPTRATASTPRPVTHPTQTRATGPFHFTAHRSLPLRPPPQRLSATPPYQTST